ncbi:MAG: hypothetical protein H6657_16495 [Ardenticatenaceae bacterium]|nr:hypothetical protein [Anaerolineales bacterium]MCB8979014.1 hypothetical protein [Ardenticatenaceae bacterium]
MHKLATGFVSFLLIGLLWGALQLLPGTQEVSAMTPAISHDPQPICAPQVCPNGDLSQWLIVSPESSWEAEEEVMVVEIVTAVINSLNQQGLDGYALLNGYRFRRQAGEYIVDRPGDIAVVNHITQEITLADAAFKRLHGFYIIHELGHVVDQRTDRQLTANFHARIGSDLQNHVTAESYWLNLHAQNDLEEATADALALYVMSTYAPGYRPVFAQTPVTTDFDGIRAAMATTLEEVAAP